MVEILPAVIFHHFLLERLLDRVSPGFLLATLGRRSPSMQCSFLSKEFANEQSDTIIPPNIFGSTNEIVLSERKKHKQKNQHERRTIYENQNQITIAWR